MKPRLLAGLVLAASLVATATQADALSLSLSDVEGDGIVELFLDPEGSIDLRGYTFFLEYDDAELGFQSYTHTPPSPVTPDFVGALDSSTPGLLSNFNGFAFPSGSATITTKILLGTFTFDVASGAVADGSRDISFAPETVGFEIALAGDVILEVSQIPVVYGVGLDVGQVPEPGVALLLGAGLIVLGARRRRDAGRAGTLAAGILVALGLAAATGPASAEPVAETAAVGAERADGFTEAVMRDQPLLSAEVPASDEVWIRVKPEEAARAADVMEAVGHAFHDHFPGAAASVRVRLFAGGRPVAERVVSAAAE